MRRDKDRLRGPKERRLLELIRTIEKEARPNAEAIERHRQLMVHVRGALDRCIDRYDDNFEAAVADLISDKGVFVFCALVADSWRAAHEIVNEVRADDASIN